MNAIPDLRKIDINDMSGEQMRFFKNIAIELHDSKFLKKLQEENNRFF